MIGIGHDYTIESLKTNMDTVAKFRSLLLSTKGLIGEKIKDLGKNYKKIKFQGLNWKKRTWKGLISAIRGLIERKIKYGSQLDQN